jgi:hypothetical protein
MSNNFNLENIETLEKIVAKGPDISLVNGSYELALNSLNPVEKPLVVSLLHQYLKRWFEISNTYVWQTDDRSFFGKDPYFRALGSLPSKLNVICADVLLKSKPFLNSELLQKAVTEYAATAEILQKLTKKR